MFHVDSTVVYSVPVLLVERWEASQEFLKQLPASEALWKSWYSLASGLHKQERSISLKINACMHACTYMASICGAKDPSSCLR